MQIIYHRVLGILSIYGHAKFVQQQNHDLIPPPPKHYIFPLVHTVICREHFLLGAGVHTRGVIPGQVSRTINPKTLNDYPHTPRPKFLLRTKR